MVEVLGIVDGDEVLGFGGVRRKVQGVSVGGCFLEREREC